MTVGGQFAGRAGVYRSTTGGGWRSGSRRRPRAFLPVVGEALAEARRASLDVPPPRLAPRDDPAGDHALITDWSRKRVAGSPALAASRC